MFLSAFRHSDIILGESRRRSAQDVAHVVDPHSSILWSLLQVQPSFSSDVCHVPGNTVRVRIHGLGLHKRLKRTITKGKQTLPRALSKSLLGYIFLSASLCIAFVTSFDRTLNSVNNLCKIVLLAHNFSDLCREQKPSVISSANNKQFSLCKILQAAA